MDPISAATHHDPYPYYARLVAERPLYFDASLNLWVASSAEAVTEVLSSELCTVRPSTEPVPRALLGSRAGEIFGRLVRMTDGPRHQKLKEGVSATLDSAGAGQIAAVSNRWAERLCDSMKLKESPDHLNDFVFRLPVFVVAELSGLPENSLEDVATLASDFVRCFSALSSADQIDKGKVAAERLLELYRSSVRYPRNIEIGGLLTTLDASSSRLGEEAHRAVIANGIGLLTQTYEATAGLIGNTLVALARHQDLRDEIRDRPELLGEAVLETLRYDSPVQNTRRFVSVSGTVGGQKMSEGDAILVLVAAANRDPAANPEPQSFHIVRENRRTFTFGLGRHACPGEVYARLIAEAALRQLIETDFDLSRLARDFSYRRSANVRAPVFGLGESKYL